MNLNLNAVALAWEASAGPLTVTFEARRAAEGFDVQVFCGSSLQVLETISGPAELFNRSRTLRNAYVVETPVPAHYGGLCWGPATAS